MCVYGETDETHKDILVLRLMRRNRANNADWLCDPVEREPLYDDCQDEILTKHDFHHTRTPVF